MADTSGIKALRWQSAFWDVVQQPNYVEMLKSAGVNSQLSRWTTALTEVVVSTCDVLGWIASAKGFTTDLIPVATNEFLAMDVMAFPQGSRRWQLPIAVVELENNRERSAYSLWKMLCVRVELRLLFCYCENARERKQRIDFLTREVIGAMSVNARQELRGDTVVVVGSRQDIYTFPDGYFKWWELEKNTGLFRLM